MPRFNKKFDTVGAETMVLFSETVEENRFMQGDCRVCGVTDDYAHGLIYQVSLCARRAVGGDVTLSGLIEASDDDFGGQKPTVAVVANASLQAIQIVAEGLANMSITWTIYSVMFEQRD